MSVSSAHTLPLSYTLTPTYSGRHNVQPVKLNRSSLVPETRIGYRHLNITIRSRSGQYYQYQISLRRPLRHLHHVPGTTAHPEQGSHLRWMRSGAFFCHCETRVLCRVWQSPAKKRGLPRWANDVLLAMTTGLFLSCCSCSSFQAIPLTHLPPFTPTYGVRPASTYTLTPPLRGVSVSEGESARAAGTHVQPWKETAWTGDDFARIGGGCD